ncbi:MAG TPA: hypothetical protein VKB37_05645 [Jatrophihabitantaceae bacterium]|nr:hypothetical protein [Jatrophihabitantaceae bacterium]
MSKRLRTVALFGTAAALAAAGASAATAATAGPAHDRAHFALIRSMASV